MINHKLWVVFLILAIYLNQASASDRIITFVGDPWPPYVEGELGHDAESGIAVKIVREIFSKIEHSSARFPLIPWQRALEEVEQGHHDGIALLLKTPERQAYMTYSVPFIVGSNLVWSAASDNGEIFEWNQIEDFYGKRVGIIRGYSYGDIFEQAFESGMISIVRAPTVEHMFAMLANGRIDLVLANDAVGTALARKYPDADITAASKPTEPDVFFLAISKKSSAVTLIPQINRIIVDLQAEGFIERVIGSD